MASRVAQDRVRLPVARAAFRRAAFLSWRYPVAVVEPLLPSRLRVDAHDGSAWVSIVAFSMADVRPPGTPVRRGIGFDQTNLRTYVRGPDGRDGLWFFSLDVPSRLGALAARAASGAPYRDADLHVRDAGTAITYTGRRADAAYEIVVGGDRTASAPVDELAVWLTGRWHAYTCGPLGLTRMTVEHEPWPLRTASLESVWESLTVAAGLPRPAGPAVLHWSPGVEQMSAALPRPLR